MHFDWTHASLGDVIALAGVIVAAVAVVVAMVQLVRSRQDLIDERRADFQLDHLAEIRLALHEARSRIPPASLAARVKLLPDVKLPALRAWVEADDSEAEAVQELAREHFATGDTVAWLKERGQLEVDRAVRRILAGRGGGVHALNPGESDDG